MKKFVLLCLTTLFSIATWAADFDVDGLYYTKLTDSTVEVASTPSGADKYTGDIVVPPTVRYDDEDFTVVGIGRNAFSSTNLTSIELPSTITYIDSRAFYSCNMPKIDIPEGVTSVGSEAFFISHLTEVMLPETLTSLGDFAFDGSYITSVNIPKNVSSMGECVFASCPNLSEVTFEYGMTVIGEGTFMDDENLTTISEIPGTVTYIGESAFCRTMISSINIPKSVTVMGEMAFAECELLSNVTLEEGLTFIGDYAFLSCELLMQINIPSSIEVIGLGAFTYTGLRTLTIPGSVTSIGEEAFEGCYYLTQVTFGDGFSLTNISNRMFYEDRSLKSITLPSSITTIEDEAFRYSGLTSIDFPENISTIGEYAFGNCTSLTTITFPETITSIGEYVCQNCTSLEEATILANISKIESNSFYGCTALTKVSIPKTVANIAAQAFYNCKSLTSITSLNREAPICGTSVFSSVPTSTCILYVPNGSENSYSTAPLWEDFTNIVGIEVEDDPDEDETKFVEDGIYYQCVDKDAMTVEVTYESSSFNYYAGTIDIPATVTHNAKEYAVIGIGYSAFRLSPELIKVTIPESVTYIDTYAFYDNSALQEVSLPSGITEIGEYTFYNCKSLSTITIPANVTLIDYYAFGDSSLAEFILGEGEQTLDLDVYSLCGCKIESLYLGRNVSFSGNNVSSMRTAFRMGGSGNISTITFGENITSLCDYEFYSCKGIENIIIPGHITTLGDYAFSSCGDLKSVTFCEGITALSKNTFTQCTSLKEINFPESLTDMGERTFQSCTALEEVTISCNVTSAPYAFRYCSALKKVTFSEGCTTISTYMFDDCTSLNEVIFPSTLTTISSNAFYRCTSLEKVLLPEGVTSVSGFDNCSSLNYILLPQSVTHIGRFQNCSALKKVIVPKLVDDFTSSYIFQECSNLEEVIILGDIQSYSFDTFYGCSSLGKIYSLTSTPPSKQPGVGTSSLFRGLDTDNCVLYVPVGAKETYANDENWGEFTHIEELGEPLAITYGTTVLTTDSVEITGYIAVGSVGIAEVGFEYWSDESDVKTITATVEDMKADLTDLPYATTYTYRAYAKTTTGNTIYGDNLTFTTEGTNVDKIEEVASDTTQVGSTTVEGYYTVDGRRISSPQRGVNIVRYEDGTAKKILVK